MKNRIYGGIRLILFIFVIFVIIHSPVIRATLEDLIDAGKIVPALLSGIAMFLIIPPRIWPINREETEAESAAEQTTVPEEDISAESTVLPEIQADGDAVGGEVPEWISWVSRFAPIPIILVIVLLAKMESMASLPLLPLPFFLMHGENLYRLFVLREDREMLWGSAENARAARRRSLLDVLRWIGAVYIFRMTVMVIAAVSGLVPDSFRGSPAWTLTALSLLTCGIVGMGILWNSCDPFTFLRRDIRSEKRYTVKKLYETLSRTDTMFGSPGIARIRSHGRAVLYGPTKSGVYVFLIPSPLRKRISVRLMAAESEISQYEEMPAYTVEIDERLNGRGPRMDFEAVLDEMTAEIDRLLYGAGERP